MVEEDEDEVVLAEAAAGPAALRRPAQAGVAADRVKLPAVI